MGAKQRGVTDDDQLKQIAECSFNRICIGAVGVDEIGNDANDRAKSRAIVEHSANARAEALMRAAHFVQHTTAAFDRGFFVAHLRKRARQLRLRLAQRTRRSGALIKLTLDSSDLISGDESAHKMLQSGGPQRIEFAGEGRNARIKSAKFVGQRSRTRFDSCKPLRLCAAFTLKSRGLLANEIRRALRVECCLLRLLTAFAVTNRRLLDFGRVALRLFQGIFRRAEFFGQRRAFLTESRQLSALSGECALGIGQRTMSEIRALARLRFGRREFEPLLL